MGDLSRNFDRSEFRCRHCRALKGPPRSLVLLLEKIRALTHEPLVVVSGYRCPTHNRAVGGARASRHLAGDAADIPAGQLTLDQAQRLGARGIGVRGSWVVHVDMRPGRVAIWHY